MPRLLILILLVAAPATDAQRRRRPPPVDYSLYVKQCADTILAAGIDFHGPEKTPLWAGAINATDLSVPRDLVPAANGRGAPDSGAAGCNLYHDAATLRAFRILSAVLGEPKYATAARDYIGYFLERARDEQTELLAWGEQLYYDLYRDELAGGREPDVVPGSTPPWSELWEVNPSAVREAISALRNHYGSDDPNALSDRPALQSTADSTCFDHAGLYAYSFMFLYRRTGERKWLAWSRGASDRYWEHRNRSTNLAPSCGGEPAAGTGSSSGEQVKLAYWLLKTYQLNPREIQMWQRGVALLKSWAEYAYDRELDQYHGRLNLAGEGLDQGVLPWGSEPGSQSLLAMGRVAAYFARTEKSPEFLEIADRVLQIAGRSPQPDDVALRQLAYALNLSLDLYQLTEDEQYLDEARRYAGQAIDRFWVPNPVGGLFVRVPGDGYYTAKSGAGYLLAGFLRLHIQTNRWARDPGLWDWSF